MVRNSLVRQYTAVCVKDVAALDHHILADVAGCLNQGSLYYFVAQGDLRNVFSLVLSHNHSDHLESDSQGGIRGIRVVRRASQYSDVHYR